MKLKRPRNEKTRLMLTLELAVVLPAAALVILSALHLESIQRDRGVQAAFQRDFSQVLAISEKQMNQRAYELIDDVRDEFPPSGAACAETMDRILATHPYVAYLFMYDPASGMVFRSQPARANSPAFRSERDYLAPMYTGWIQMNYADMEKELEQLAKKGRRYPLAEWVPRGEKHVYVAGQFFLTGGTGEKKAIGGMMFDADYLHDQFFPEMLNTVLSHQEEKGEEPCGDDVASEVRLHAHGGFFRVGRWRPRSGTHPRWRIPRTDACHQAARHYAGSDGAALCPQQLPDSGSYLAAARGRTVSDPPQYFSGNGAGEIEV